jgi:murein DD-endopeptidase MepM/ murein hydrolase activator NlpD
MNLFLVGNRGQRIRKLHLTAAQGTALIGGAALVLLGIGVAAGVALTTGQRLAAEQRIAGMQALISAQSRELDVLEQSLQDTLDAVVAQVGALNARLIRLDALGGRLTRIAELDDGEFDFDSAPPMGGPMMPDEMAGTSIDEQTVIGELLGLRASIDDRARQLAALESVLLTREIQQKVEPNGAPVDGGWISSYYGRRTDPITSDRAFHSGIDFAGQIGMKVKAVADGVVTSTSRRTGYGNLIEITHGNGLVTRYAHNDKHLVDVGERVSKGQVIALMGSTGRATGPNLHFEVLQDGRSVNPISYVRGKGSR